MPIQLDNDIWYLVIDLLHTRTLLGSDYERENAKATLLSLRLTSRFLALATAPQLLWHIKVNKLDDKSLQRLQYLLKSSTSCSVVKRYELCPKIITSRQGDLQASPYHKIPPHLDYGRNSSSPIIQSENRHLRESSAHFAQQYRIIYPSGNKAAAALKGAFKWSSTSGKAGLKDSIYFTALAAFANLQDLRISYPPQDGSRLIRVIGEEYSTALGRYLATSPHLLLALHLQHIAPNDVVILAQSMTEAAKQRQSKIDLQITNLQLSLSAPPAPADDTLHVFPDMPPALLTLMGQMSQLQKLVLTHGVTPSAKQPPRPSPHLLLSPFKAPPMPQLRDLTLQNVAISLEDLLALVVSSPTRLTRLAIASVSLTDSSWAKAFQTFAASDTLEYFLQPFDITQISYYDLTTGASKRSGTEEDRRAQHKWQDMIEKRVSRSTDYESIVY